LNCCSCANSRRRWVTEKTGIAINCTSSDLRVVCCVSKRVYRQNFEGAEAVGVVGAEDVGGAALSLAGERTLNDVQVKLLDLV